MSDDALHDPAAPAAGEFSALADQIYRERVQWARQMSGEEKFLAGEELFHYACSITLAGIRN